MLDLKSVFASDGQLSKQIPGFRARAQQLEMAQAIAETIEKNGLLVAEAGTGTGKTFAYLVPALLAGGKVIISTGTKTLQDQLFNRDIPSVRAALNVPVSVALLKGRANYICHYHLERALPPSLVFGVNWPRASTPRTRSEAPTGTRPGSATEKYLAGAAPGPS